MFYRVLRSEENKRIFFSAREGRAAGRLNIVNRRHRPRSSVTLHHNRHQTVATVIFTNNTVNRRPSLRRST